MSLPLFKHQWPEFDGFGLRDERSADCRQSGTSLALHCPAAREQSRGEQSGGEQSWGGRTSNEYALCERSSRGQTLDELAADGRTSGRRVWGRRRRERGMIIIVAIIIVFALAGLVLAMCQNGTVDSIAAANRVAEAQASTIERGGEQYLIDLINTDGQDVLNEDESYFKATIVGDGYFWVVRPIYEDSSQPVFGLVDEASKLNLNTASEASLAALEGMTDESAASTVDWRDDDSETTANGAENDYYGSLPDPYQCKNAPLESVEEVLLIKGWTRQMLYGTGGGQPLGQVSSSSGIGTLDLNSTLNYNAASATYGLMDEVTVWSSEPASSSSSSSSGSSGSTQVVNINSPSRDQLRALMDGLFGATRGEQIMVALGPGNFEDVFDFYFRGGLTESEFDQIYSSITTQPAGSGAPIRGRINVNTAPREVLATLEGLDSSDVDKLVSARLTKANSSSSSSSSSSSTSSSSSSSSTTSTSLAWVATALGRKSIGLGNQITGQSYQYMADIVAVSGDGRAFKRVRVVIDASQSPPKILYRRDVTDRGWPMDPSILTSLRNGEGVSN